MTSSGPSELDETYRGLLFADLRGYSADVERYGDRAASALLDAYRSLMRHQVAEHAGAEIKTEGDSFYVVFPSARRAVLCAMGIVSTAASHNAGGSGIPIRVGIGVHAGEAVQGAEGYVGSAINIAARVCAAAQAGEVLVTRTVRDLTRTGLTLEYVPRGSHRLKGIAEPVQLFAVRAAGQVARPGFVRRARTIAANRLRGYGIPLAVGLLAFAIAVFFGNQLVGRGDAAHSPSAHPGSTASGAAVGSTASPTAAAFPNDAESRLLARIDPSLVSSCKRADPAAAPRTTNYPLRPIPVAGGVRCRPVGEESPDVVEYWAQRSLEQPYLDAATAFFSRAGIRKLPPGDCATDERAFGKWKNGLFSGNVLCDVTTREATMMWTYDGDAIIATAIREDSNGRLLYAWWRDHARTLRPAT